MPEVHDDRPKVFIFEDLEVLESTVWVAGSIVPQPFGTDFRVSLGENLGPAAGCVEERGVRL